MKRHYKVLLNSCILAIVILLSGCRCNCHKPVFSFDVAADMRQYADPDHQSPEYFKGVCQAILQTGKGAFMVSPGDIDPPDTIYEMVNTVLGSDYPWYPVVGNHEAETPENMKWLQEYGREKLLDHVSAGPEGCEETTYSFDYKNAHMIVINEYYDGPSDTAGRGRVSDALYEWIKRDLKSTSKPFIFVFGHEPFVSIPDVENGRHRHRGDNLDEDPQNAHRFAKLLRQHSVTAYICGHTHNFSYAKINGLWQIDAGHARGIGDKGSPSTFLKVYVGVNNCWVKAYRSDHSKNTYLLTHTVTLD